MQDWFESWVWLDNIVPAKKARAQEDAIMGSWRSESWWTSKDCPAAAIWTTAIEGEQKSYAFLSIVDPSQLPDSHLVCIIHMLLGSFYSLFGSVWSELWVTHPIIYGKWQQMFHFCFFVPLPFKKKKKLTCLECSGVHAHHLLWRIFNICRFMKKNCIMGFQNKWKILTISLKNGFKKTLRNPLES